MNEFAFRLSEMNQARGWNYTLATCAERIPLEKYSIEHNKCIDDELMIRLASNNEELMKFLGVEVTTLQPSLFGNTIIPDHTIKISGSTYAVTKKNNKDKGQRNFCGCIVSKDIGQYNTCPHQCKYCYANTSRQSALDNYNRHKKSPLADMIIGE
jgi:hypothetical protein